MNLVTKVLLVLALSAILSPAEVLACACCSERGDYYEHESEFSDHMRSEIHKLRPGSAILRTDAGFPDSIKGIEPIGENFTVTGSFTGAAWTFKLTDEQSRKATLNLRRPLKIWEFGVDQDPLGESDTVILYKELRFRDRVKSATGFLKNGVDGKTTYKLIFQGRGNGCMNASDFSTYILQVKGNNADYTFYGKLSLTDNPQMQKYVDTAGAKVANP